ncbi:MAG: patatin-like phospholipase family protein [Chitinophagales bacterium]|nr:patatin-like phospholipase family protein [Chitinophagales bacterium]
MAAKVLSIDGGGIKGMIPAKILTYIETEIRKTNSSYHLEQSFDLIAGTSTGGIIALGLLSPDKDGNAKFLAGDLLDLYLNKGGQIFETDFFRKLDTLGGLTDELYGHENIERLFKEYFDDIRMSDLLKPCLITSYNIFDRCAVFFNSNDVKKGGDYHNYFVRDLARSTSAAPTYFEPAYIKAIDGKTQYPLIDGGVFANNPSMSAVVEMGKMLTRENEKWSLDLSDIFVLSIGCGVNTQTKKSFPYEKVKNWGKLSWVAPIIDIMMSASSETIDYQLRKIFAATGNPDNYLRIQPELRRASADMDDTRPENMEKLQEDADDFIAKNTELLQRVIQKILQ